MKKTETKICPVRGVHDPSKAIVKIKRHSFTQSPPNARKVVFNIPSGSKNVVSLPTHIPEDHLKELENEIMNKRIPESQNDKPPKRMHGLIKQRQPVKSSSKSSVDSVSFPADSSPEYVLKLAADIQAIEDKLSKVENALTKSVEEKLTTVENILTQVVDEPLKKGTISRKKSPDSKRSGTENRNALPYNASDYIDDSPPTGDYTQDYVIGSYVSELHRQVIMPLKSQPNLNYRYPVDYDSKSAINAIRSELDEWRKTRQTSNPNPQFYEKKSDIGSSSLGTPKSEASSKNLYKSPSLLQTITTRREIAVVMKIRTIHSSSY